MIHLKLFFCINYKKRYPIIITNIIPVSPWINVDIVWLFKAVVVFISENWATTQKKLSFKWDTVIAPAPIDNTDRALPISESRPKDSSIGAIMAAVVIIETVEEPWADFKIAAIINGKSRPRFILEKLFPMMSPRPVDCRIAPNDPPAPVIKMIIPASFKPSVIQLKWISFLFFGFN